MAAAREVEVGKDLAQRFRRLATSFGFGQGCCVNVYLSAAGYFGDLYGDPYFFVLMCGAIYLTPLLAFPVQFAFDPYFDSRFGLQTVFQFRLAASLLLAAVLVAAVSLVTEGDHRLIVLVLGAVGGLLCGCVASASSQFFGVISPKLMPLFFLGQTASGAYVNVAARVAGFKPDASRIQVVGYYIGGVSLAILPPIAFAISQWTGRLAAAYCHHARLASSTPGGDVHLPDLDDTPNRSLRTQDRDDAPADVDFLVTASLNVTAKIEPQCPQAMGDRHVQVLAFLAQVLFIALNMSLTPLANVMAHGSYSLGQEIVLLKLLGDFLGRLLYLLWPRPRRLRLHVWLAVALALARVPLWAAFVVHTLRKEPLFDFNVLAALWVPFVAAGALGGSWTQVIGIQAAPGERKRRAAAMMSVAVYAGYLVGLGFAVAVAVSHNSQQRLHLDH